MGFEQLTVKLDVRKGFLQSLSKVGTVGCIGKQGSLVSEIIVRVPEKNGCW